MYGGKTLLDVYDRIIQYDDYEVIENFVNGLLCETNINSD